MGCNRNLFILYDYFYPGYKAGGPIQSLSNLAVALSEHYSIYVITGSRDLLSTEIYKGVTVNQWNEVYIPGSKNAAYVYYADNHFNKKTFKALYLEIKPAVIYFNNIYSNSFFRLPLHTLKSIPGNYKVVVCPRGMLQRGALAVKPLKKKVYLSYLRFTGLLNKAYWHATNQEELNDIQQHFPWNKGITIAPNIPKPPLSNISFRGKEQGLVKLVFLSLIAEKKNLVLLLQLMLTLQTNIVLDVYGPVTDNAYWQQCKALIQQMPDKVQYKGEVQPADVQKVLSQYHALVLLTKGENFGHALYESLSVGRPVITSYFTPWNNLQQSRGGANVDISNMQDCIDKVNQFVAMNQDEYNLYCRGAHTLAIQYFQNLNAEERYRELFG